MDNIRYLNGKQVQLLRTFVLGGVNYSEVMPSGEEESLVVVTSELNDNVQEKKARKSKIVKVFMHDNVFDIEKHKKQEIEYLNAMHKDEESIPSFSVYEQAFTESTAFMEQPDISAVVEFNERASEAIERLNLTIESEEDTVEFDTVDEFMEDISVIVFATNVKTDEEISLGEISELATSETVINLVLDPEAIQRCLDGEQKTHKGFTFDIK